MKKLCSLIVCAVIIICAVSPAFAEAKTGKYIVSATWANVLKTPSLSSGAITEVKQGTYLTVSEIYGDFMGVYVPSAGTSGWVYADMLTFAGDEAQNPENIQYIGISTKPSKTVYTEDEETLDITGLTVYAMLSNNTKKLISGYSVYCDAFDSSKQNRIYVRYTPNNCSYTFSTFFDVTVNRVPLKSLTVETAPVKTQYIENQLLDLKGLSLRAKYTDGRSDKIFSLDEILSDSNFTMLGTNSTANGKKLYAGTQTLNIYYKYPEITTSLKINVSKRVLTSFEITNYPNALTVYSNTQVPDLTGLLMKATYDNGETEDVTADDCKISCTPSEFVYGAGSSINGLNCLTLTFGGQSVSIYFTYRSPEIKGIKISTPKVLSFIVGEETDLSELKVYLEYTSGELTEVKDYILSEPDLLQIGNQQLTVKYGKYSGAFNITISPYYQRGDIDGNGLITSADARLALRHSVNLVTLKGLLFTAGDANRDGRVDAADARLILRASVGLEDFLAFLK